MVIPQNGDVDSENNGASDQQQFPLPEIVCIPKLFNLFVAYFFYRCTCSFKIHLLSHTNKCTNYIIYYLKSVLIIDIKTIS
jgi:hypothetical protein